MNYYNQHEMSIEGTYIISIQGNKVSEQLTQQCLASCEKVGQPNVQVFPAFDATGSKVKVQQHDLGLPVGELGSIKVPEFLQGQAFLNFLRLKRCDLLMTQIACFLSHYSLWCMCLDKDRPIVILEHDLVSYAIHHGIITTADAMMRYDMFGIVQNGVYAYDNPHDQSTITLDGKVAKT